MRGLARSTVAAVVTTLVLALPAVAAPLVFPMRGEDGFFEQGPPDVTASSWILYDESSDTVLASRDADTRRPMASITKIMTVMIALERGDLNDQVTVSQRAAETGAQEIGLVAGETVELGWLVRAALLRSGNDAATAIAEHIAGSVEGFIGIMNQRASELGMENTLFANPHGLDMGGHYSSPRDMLIVARQAMSIPQFAEIARARVMVFPDTPSGTARSATNTNRILNSYEGIIGVKTGETPNAGLTYVGAAERDGRRLFAIVFRSVGQRAHFADAIALFDWAFDSLRIHGTLVSGTPYQPVAARVAPSPLVVEAGLETLLHASAQGITAGASTPAGGDSAPTPSEMVDITRHPDPAPDSFLSTFTYWLGLATGVSDD
jgi:D-alanyl-D-alanine carboxypeptidase